MRRLLLAAGVALAALGTLVAAPLALPRWRLVAAKAVITDVFLQPAGDGQVRVLVAFEFAVAAHGERDTWCSLSHNLGDARLRPVPDPVVSRAQGQAIARRLLGDDPRFRPSVVVHYPAGHPEDAVMVAPTPSGASRGYDVGLALLASGMLLIVVGRRLPVSDG